MLRCYAIGRALQGMIGSRGKTSYEDLGMRYIAFAEDQAKCLTAEIDINGDGVGDVVIDLGMIDALKG